MDLRAAGLDAEGGVELARALRGNDALEILNLKASGVDTQGAEAIVDALRENRMLQWHSAFLLGLEPSWTSA